MDPDPVMRRIYILHCTSSIFNILKSHFINKKILFGSADPAHSRYLNNIISKCTLMRNYSVNPRLR